MRLPAVAPKRLGSGLAASVVPVALAVLVGEALNAWLHLPNLSMVFLLAVLVCAERFGLWSAISASLLSFLAFNFFFIEPIYTFTVASRRSCSRCWSSWSWPY